MSFVLKFNKFILVSILLDWFDLETFGMLAKSFGKSYRTKFIDIVREYSSKFKLSLVPQGVFIPLSTNALRWFDIFGFGCPDSIILNWSIFEELEVGIIILAVSVLSGKYKSRRVDWELLQYCLSNVKAIRLVSYKEGKYLAKCKSLESFEVVNGLPYSTNILTPICGPTIKSLDFTGFKFDSEHYNNLVCRSCPNLTTLKFMRFHGFTQSLLATLIVHCRQLTTLNFNSRDDIDNRPMQQFIFFVPCHVIHLPFTCSLTLRLLIGYRGKVQQSLSMLNAQECVLDAVETHCSVLTSLVIRGVYSVEHIISSQSLLVIASRLSNLHICESSFVSDYFKFLPECPVLDTLRLQECKLTTSVLALILSRCWNVKNLVVGSNELDDSIGDALKALPGLRKLHISNNSVSDKLLLVLAAHCNKISALEVSYCPLITDEGMCSVVRNGRLAHLCIDGCSLLTVESVKSIAVHCPGIHFLKMNGTKEFHDSILADLNRFRKCFSYFQIIA